MVALREVGRPPGSVAASPLAPPPNASHDRGVPEGCQIDEPTQIRPVSVRDSQVDWRGPLRFAGECRPVAPDARRGAVARAGRVACRSRPAEGTMGRGSCTGQRSDPPHWSETPPDERHLRGRGPRRPPHCPGARARRRPGRPQHDPGPRHRRRRRGVHHRADHARVPPQGPDRVRGPPGPRSDRRAGLVDRLGRDRPPGDAAGAGAAPARREERDRGRLGQGRRRQEHGQRQPRRRARARRRRRGPAGRRHHRPQHPDDARRRGPADLERQQQDRPARAPRREGDLDPVLRPRGPADRVARPARSAARSRSSCATSSGASSTTSSSTCRPGRRTRS